MVEERTCDFSGESIEPGTGIMYVRTDGTVLHFVDAKAEKNYFLGREARDLEWTEAGRRAGRARSEEDTEPRETTDSPDESTPEEENEAAADQAE